MPLTLQEGAVFARRYRVMHCIAAGGMGEVYEVIHLETERRRALKVMLPHVLRSPELRERFKREAKLAAHIESDFIVDVFDAGVDDATGMPFLVMELLRGEELGRRLERLGPFSPEEVVTYLHQTAMALDKTHQAAIVHRDLKPANLFLTECDDGAQRIKVLDFGIAKVLADGMTGAGATCGVGTPLYMSPEQFRAESRVSPATDIYALGMIAYTFLVGRPYWAAEMEKDWSIFAFAKVAAKGPREPARARAAAQGVDLPPAFNRWFARATAVPPAHRFSTALRAVKALAEVFDLPLPRAGIAPFSRRAPARSAAVGGSMPTELNAAVTRTLSRRGASSLVAAVALLSMAGTAVCMSLFRSPPQAARSADPTSLAPQDSALPFAMAAPVALSSSAPSPPVEQVPTERDDTRKVENPPPVRTPPTTAPRPPALVKAPKKYTRD